MQKNSDLTSSLTKN